MKPTIILFEDQRVPCFRPLAWSTPLYELRCGMFTPRERIERVLAAAGLEADLGGLCRPLLAPLNQAPRWSGHQALTAFLADGHAGPVLFLNGRLGAHPALIEALVREAGKEREFSLQDAGDLVAAAVTAERAAGLLKTWRATDPLPADDTPPWPAPEQLPTAAPTVDSATLAAGLPLLHRWIWELVPATAAAIRADLGLVGEAGVWRRLPFGLAPDPQLPPPTWQQECRLTPGGLAAEVVGPVADLWTGPGCRALPGAVIDTRSGPVVLDRDVELEAHVMLQGPLYLGPGCRVKAGARIYGESSFGVGCRLAGEIGESVFGDFANKQHEGFIGHAVLGSWINLGALTTCSDLKNNYGPVRVDLGDGPVDTGLRFVGLMMGDHAKTAIGTLLNTGTSVGFASNLFGSGMPPKQVGNFRWGGGDPAATTDVERALATARVVMGRRGCLLTPAHEALFRALA